MRHPQPVRASTSWGTGSAGSPIRAIGLPTATVVPTGARILRRTPVTGATISTPAFAVSISTSGALCVTALPSGASHSTISASVMPMPSWGRRITYTSRHPLGLRPHRGANGVLDVSFRREDPPLERRAEGDGNRGTHAADDRGLEIGEAEMGDLGGHLGGKPAEGVAVIGHHEPSGLGDRSQDGRRVEGQNGPRIHHLHGDAL